MGRDRDGDSDRVIERDSKRFIWHLAAQRV